MFRRGELAAKCLPPGKPSGVDDGTQSLGIGIVSLLGATRRERKKEAFGK